MLDSSDNDLMAQAAKGSRAALGVLFNRHHQRVRALVYRMTGDSAVADDLCQETFLRIMRYGRSFDQRSQFRTWLYRVVRNVTLDHIDRERGRKTRREDPGTVHSMRTQATQSTQHDDDREILHRALLRLTPDKREILVLARFEGYKYAEIAELTGSTEGAVKVKAHRALRELREIYLALEES